MKFNKRTTKPSSTDKNYIRHTKGGYNYCIEINNGSVIPNCVGYAWGRWREILGRFHELSRGNAEVWYGKNDGYERGKTPRLGSVICWSQGSAFTGRDGQGHVAIVEEVHPDGTILTSNSAYKGDAFYLKTLKPPYNMGGTYKFQGFIHLPVKMEVEKPSVGKKTNHQIAEEVVLGKWGNGQARKDALSSAGYNYKAIQKLVDEMLSPKPAPSSKTIEQLAKEVINGDWGNGSDRINRLSSAGYDYKAVQKLVDKMLNPKPAPNKKTIEQLAKEVINGDWGNGADRVNRLTKAGYDAKAVQARVDQLLRKTDLEIAKEVRLGKWGNGADRVNRLKKAGYNPSVIQSIVNKLVMEECSR